MTVQSYQQDTPKSLNFASPTLDALDAFVSYPEQSMVFPVDERNARLKAMKTYCDFNDGFVDLRDATSLMGARNRLVVASLPLLTPLLTALDKMPFSCSTKCPNEVPTPRNHRTGPMA